MKKTITVEVPEEEAIKFSEEVARLAAQMERAEAEDVERQARSAQRQAEFEEGHAAIRQSLQRIEQRDLASAAYWQELLRQQALELENLKREKQRLLKQVALACVFCWLACATAFAQGSPAASSPALEEASQLNQQAVKLHQEGKSAEAIPLAKKALKLREEALGQNHELVGITLFNLGSFHYSAQQYLEAESPYKRALQVYEATYGAEDDRLSVLLVRLGWIQHFKSAVSQAEGYFNRHLSLAEKNHSQEHVNVEAALISLGQFQEKIGKPEKAIPFMIRAIAIQEKLYGEIHKNTADTVEKCACLMAITNNAKGGAYLDRAMRIQSELATGVAPVSPKVLQGVATHKEAPEYPSAAKAARLSGTIIVKVLIGEDGTVIEATRLCGPDLLAPGAVNAARKWRFKPSVVNGNPTKVNGLLTFNFRL